ncbi:unnamed protein product [Sphacelaria rigidula]
MLRIRAYNATNARLLGFVIRLSFGQGAEASGMSDGGRVETTVDEVLMPAAAYTLEVPVAPIGGLKDIVVHVTLIFPDAEPEPEFEQEGTAELLGGEAFGAASAGGEGGAAHFGGHDDALEGAGLRRGAGRGGVGGESVRVSLHAGSYRLPAEAFLGPPSAALSVPVAWLDFQTVWSGLPFVHAVPVENCQMRGEEGLMRSAAGVVWAMSMLTKGGIEGRGGGRGAHDGIVIGGAVGEANPRVLASVRCPGGNTDYAVSAAWAFEAWDGTPVLCALTAMKAPFSGSRTGDGWVGGGQDGEQQQVWNGRMEFRCGSQACANFARSSSRRLTRFVTNGVFAPSVADGGEQGWQFQFGGGAGATAPGTAPTGGLNGAHVDWFSRMDVSLPGGRGGRLPGSVTNSPVGGRGGGGSGNGSGGGGRNAHEKAQILSLVGALRARGRIDTTRGKE